LPSWRRPPGAPDADGEATRSRRRDNASSPVAEAEEELARAEAHAAEARERLARLRLQAWSLESPDADGSDIATFYDDNVGVESPAETPNRWQSPRLQRPGLKGIGLTAAFVIVGASLGGSIFMGLEHRALVREQHRTAEFAAAAREGVTNLMSIDANHAREDMLRTIDGSTGEFRDQLEHTGLALAEKAEASKISTTVTVDAVAVESTTEDSGIVLVAARSDSVSPDDAKRPLNSLRIVVHLSRDGGRLKMAKVEFLQ
jgi:Mce-associated membrane protein